MKKVIGEELRKTREEFQKQLVVLVTGAFAFTAALFWNTAIKNTITHFIPGAESWYWEILIAVLVTLVAVLATYFLTRLAAKKEKEEHA